MKFTVMCLVDHTPLFENHYSRMTEHEMPEANEINAVKKKVQKLCINQPRLV